VSIDVAALRRADCYPHPVGDVEVTQTHISIVCLAGDRAYKLKKAVTLPFLDSARRSGASTTAARSCG
jgi:aminoglycoside phosphotransferase family enzyme